MNQDIVTAPRKRTCTRKRVAAPRQRPPAKRKSKAGADGYYKEITQNMHCKLCFCLPRPPTITCQRGSCIMCKECVDKYVANQTNNADIRCPLCQNALFPVVSQTGIDMLLRDVPVECPNKCDIAWLTVSTVSEHNKICPMRPRNCKYSKLGCTWVGFERDELRHQSSCPYRLLAECDSKIQQLQAEADARIDTVTRRLTNAMSLLGLFQRYITPCSCFTSGGTFSRVSETACSANIYTLVTNFVLVLETRAIAGGGVDCALRSADAWNSERTVEIVAQLLFWKSANICAAGSVAHVYKAGRHACAVNYLGEFDITDARQLKFRISFDKLSDGREQEK